jgi:uncharacterized protein YoxC
MEKALKIMNEMQSRKVELSVLDDLNSAVSSIKSLESDYDIVTRQTNDFLKQARTLSGYYEQLMGRAGQTLKGYQDISSKITTAQRKYLAQAKELGIDGKKTPEFIKSLQQSVILESRIAFLKNELDNELKSAVPKL